MNSLNREFYDTVAAAFAQEQGDRLPWLSTLQEFADLLPANPEVVELGCGPGHEAIWLATHVEGAQVTGIDFSEQMIALAIRNQAANLRFLQADLADYRHPKPADGIWARGSLHHLEYDELIAALRHAAGHLSPSGIFCTINKYGTDSEIRSTSRWGQPAERYFDYFNEEKMTKAAVTSGLAITRQYVTENDEGDPYLITYLRTK